MSKRTSKKRKASEPLQATPSTFSKEAATLVGKPRAFASTMLSWLPPGSTLKSRECKNLLNTFDLVKAELQRRTNLMAQNNVEAGALRQISFRGAEVHSDVFVRVLDFLPRQEVVHKASLVCKAWLAVTRSPQLWHTLDNSTGILEKSTTITNMDNLLELLKRPQFTNLKSLTPSDKVQFRKKAFEHISKACPMLEELDVGYSLWSCMHIDNATLLSLPSLFPHLTKIRLDQYKVTDAGIAAFGQQTGDRLVSIRVRDSFNCRQKLSDETLVVISRCCPNLECFAYEFCESRFNRGETECILTEKGVIALLKGCTKLKSLTLISIPTISLQLFEEIVENDAVKLDHLLLVEHQELMSNEALCANLAEKVDSFEAIGISEHNDRITVHREACQSHLYWC